MRDYMLEYAPSDYFRRDNIRKYILAFAVLFDIGAIIFLVSAFFEPLYWIAVVGMPILSNVMRYFANNYPRKYIFGSNQGNFVVDSITPLKTTRIYKSKIANIQAIDNISIDSINNNMENTLILCDNSCMNDLYVLKFSDKKIIVELDEYLFTLLDSAKCIEDNK